MDLQRGTKHAIDRLVALALVVALAPVFLLVAIAIRLDSPGGPFFLQERVGAGGRSFTIFKFRTMRRGSEHQGLGHTTAKNDNRITRVGAFLRATSLDELPQLFNIALGEMSFLGPRPTLRYQVEAYTPRQARRLLFRPGISGWAQVHGRNEIPWAERIELDLYYIDHYSLWLDLRILVRTLGVLGAGGGVYAAGGANDAFTAAEPSTPDVPDAAPDAAGSARCEPRPAAAPPGLTGGLLPLLVVGAGGHARVLVDIAEKQGRYRVAGLLDDRPQMRGTEVLGYPVLGGREVLERSDVPAHAIVAIGAPRARAAWQAHLEDRGFQLAVLVHPTAAIARGVELGAGTVLMAGAIVNPGARLGRGVIVNTASSIDHDCDIGDFTHVAPGARLAGGVEVGARSHVGLGACVIQGVQVGADVTIGAGAAVIRPVPDGVTVAGVPARPLASQAPVPVATV